MKRNATAVWKGDLKGGKGTVTSQSGLFKDAQYGFTSRFEEGPGTNPEELIAAAHAGCFSMALSGKLGAAGMTAESITTNATLTMEKIDPAGWTVTGIHLDVKAKIPNADAAKFEQAAKDAKDGCPISRLLAPGTKITMTAALA